jgi:hypothetical protein
MTISADHFGKLVPYLLASFSLTISAGSSAQTPPAPPGPNPPMASHAADPTTPDTSAAPAPSQPPKIQLVDQTPPPPPPVARTDKTHDGFYARLNAGFGSQSTSLDAGPGVPNFSGTRGTLDLGLLIGGAPSPGIVLGGALLLDSMPSTTLEADGYSLKTGTTLATLGPFIDGYPNPRGGFHLGGTVGFSALKLSKDAGLASDRPNGFGLAAWLGYDWWVAEQWSVGGLLQLSGAHTTRSAQLGDISVDTRSIALMLTAVYQ